jgi:Flp pilus assembly protein TadD
MGRLGRPPELVLNMLRKAIDLNAREPQYRLSLAMHLVRMERKREAYRELAELTAESIDLIKCRCCLRKALQLFIEHGDCPRAAATAARLAALGSNQRDSQEHFS